MPAPHVPPVVGFGAHTSAIGELVTSVYAAGSSTVRTGDPNDPSPGVPSIPAVMDQLSIKSLGGVVSIDAEARTALLQGCCPLARAVETLVPRGLMPATTPAPAARTLGGAITRTCAGPSSFATGTFAASVRELELLEPSGEIALARRGGPRGEQFARIVDDDGPTDAFIVAARVALRPAQDYVGTRTVGADEPAELGAILATISRTGAWDGEPVEFVEAVTHGPTSHAISLGRMISAAEAPLHAVSPSRYDRGGRPYALSLVPGSRDLLTTVDYLTRWEPDGFWRSFHYGLAHSSVRRWWPRRLRTPAFYSGLDSLLDGPGTTQVLERLARWRPQSARVFREVTVPLGAVGELVESLCSIVPGVPVWTVPYRDTPPDAGGPPGAHLAEAWSAYCGIWGPGAHQRTGHNVGAENAIDRLAA
ncbi:MAG: FAD-binding protein, partial [Bifidobacteriaceae bacterium]|nr:FAD-binding protein [Bifidobacteriaceae bacterium]